MRDAATTNRAQATRRMARRMGRFLDRGGVMPKDATDAGAAMDTGNPNDDEVLQDDDALNDANRESSTDGSPDAELERLRAALKKANREARDYRLKAKSFEEAEEARQQAELSELEKAQKIAEKAQAAAKQAADELRATRLQHAVEMAATARGFHDSADALALADLSGVEIDDAGTVTGVESALDALAKSKPHLVAIKRGGVDPSPNGGSATALDSESQKSARDHLARAVKGWI